MDTTQERAALLSTQDVAARLGRSTRRVRQISADQLPYVQLEAGGWRAYDPADLERYLETRKRRSARP